MDNFSSMLIKIKSLKKERGFTNETLSQASGVPKSTLDKILAGIIKEPSIVTIIKIANALGVSAESIIEDKEPKEAFATATSESRPIKELLSSNPEWKKRIEEWENQEPPSEEHIQKVVKAYIENPTLQFAVDILLGIRKP